MISLWPDMGYPTGLVGRIGRMLFWVCTVIAGLFAALAMWAGLKGESEALAGFLFCGLAALVFYAIGRGLVYIMADE